jgi:deoxyinosine 3'endonuclease (endonuclease V)
VIRRFVAVGVAALGIATIGVARMRLSVTRAPDEKTQIEQRYQRDELMLPPAEAIGVTFRCTSGSG